MVKLFKNQKGKELLIHSYDQLLKLWDVPVAEKDIETRYGSTHVIVCGNKGNPPLVLFHGVGDNSALMWIYNAKELSKNFYLVAIDTIGGPGKSIPNSNYGKGFSQVLWIDDVIEALGLDLINIAGVSNGSYLSQLYTAKRPEKVKHSVCMAGALAVPSNAKFVFLKMIKTFLPAFFPTDKNIKKLLFKLCGVNRDVFIKSEALMLHWKYLLKYGNPMAMGFHKIEPLSEQEISIIKEKALFIVGSADPLSSKTSVEIFKTNSIKYIYIEGAGHGINHEFSSNVNSYICEYLTGRLALSI